jgi:hypothetical protein
VSGTVGARLGRLVTVGVRRALYPLLALPAGVAGLAMTVLGMRRRAGSSQRVLLHRLLDERVGGTAAEHRVTRFLVLALPLNLGAFVPAAYLWLVLVLNIGYPLRGDTTPQSLRESWGGPTLAGAWALHAVGGALVFLLVGLPVLAGLAWLQGRLARRLLATG